MGEVRVPARANYQAQTQRAVENFPISGRGLERGADPGAGADQGGRSQGQRPARRGRVGDRRRRSPSAADRVAAGEFDDDFPIDVFQTGSGTSSNMNTNEVLGTLASASLGRKVHPNDHVNASQSSNDVFPTSIHVAATEGVVRDLIPALDHLAQALEAKADEWATVVKSGRTHLMDATPVTLGQEFGGYAAQIRYGIERLQPRRCPGWPSCRWAAPRSAPGSTRRPASPPRSSPNWPTTTGLPFTEARNHFEAQGARDGLVEASGQLRTIAVGLTKICNDIRWMGSGPRAGLAEIHLPDLQPGSSIMPGKVNPVLPEATLMVAAQVIGNDATVAFAGSQGNFELNVMFPVMARNLLESIRLLANVSRLLADRCIDGIEADVGALPRVRRVVTVDRHAAEQVHRLRGGRRGRQAGPQGGQDDQGRRPRARPWSTRAS